MTSLPACFLIVLAEIFLLLRFHLQRQPARTINMSGICQEPGQHTLVGLHREYLPCLTKRMNPPWKT